MSTRKTILQGLGTQSLLHNELLIPLRSVENVFSKYCTNLGVRTDDPSFPVYLPGSSTLIKYKERYFLVCTCHQLAQTLGEDLSKVSIMIPKGNGTTVLVSSGGYMSYAQHDDGDHQQIVLFDFTEPCKNIPEMRHWFLDFRGQHPSLPANKVLGFLSYGFPTQYTDAEYELGTIDVQKRLVFGKYAAPESDPAIHNITLYPRIEFDPDGMSGGPTFCIIETKPERFEIHLAGITVRANSSSLRAVKAGAIQAVLNAALSRPSSR